MFFNLENKKKKLNKEVDLTLKESPLKLTVYSGEYPCVT